MAESISIIYITARERNMFHWFTDGLERQLEKYPDLVIQIVFVKPETYLNAKIGKQAGRLSILMVPALPSPFQGKHRITKEIYFSASNARNTGFAHAIHPYVVFVDDTSVIGPRWLEAAVEGMRDEQVILGTYEKRSDMVVEDGVLISCSDENSSIDPRVASVAPDAKVAAHTDQLFGCSFGMPLELALEVNGFDEMQSVTGYEDSSFGIRLGRSSCGGGAWLDRRLFTVESQDHAASDIVMKRIDPEFTMEEYMDCLSRFGVQRSKYSPEARKDASHLMLDIAYGRKKEKRAFWNFFDLREIRERIQLGEELTLADMKFPDLWWPNNKPLTEL